MENKKKIIIALRKAKTSLDKILAQVEAAETDCFPVIQQNLSVIGLLKSANLLMLENHMRREIGTLSGAKSKRIEALQSEIIRIMKTSQNK